MDRYRTVAEPRGNSILVERQWHVSGDTWKTIDRYNIDDLAHHPKKQADWVHNFVAMCSQQGKLYILHNPACPHWEGAMCNCGATDYGKTSFGSLASPEAFDPSNPELPEGRKYINTGIGPVELFQESAHCKLDTIDPNDKTTYDGHQLDAIDDCATKIVLKAAANGSR
jgi:hypothetical protein